jgi:NADH-quinone oxidoreductase subunit J
VTTLDAVLFYSFAAVAVGSALVVVGQRNPTYSAFALIVTLCSLSAIFGLLGSPFIAVLQVIVYAGAIMVLFLFVLMLLNVKAEDPEERSGGGMLKGVALALATMLVVQVGVVLQHAGRGMAASGFDASARRVAHVLFSAPYLYAFEATSVLILAALVGAVALAKKEL